MASTGWNARIDSKSPVSATTLVTWDKSSSWLDITGKQRMELWGSRNAGLERAIANQNDRSNQKQKRNAACEDRTHDLGIMRPALFQLSQSRSFLLPITSLSTGDPPNPFHGVHYLFCNSAMSEGFDPRKSKIGEKALVAFIDAEITEDLQTVRVTYSTNHTGSWNWKGCCRETEELQRSCSTILPCSLYRSTTRTSSSASSSC